MTTWLDDTQQMAWRALLVVFNRALPQMERTFREHGLRAIEYGMLVALSESPARTRRLGELADMADMSQSRLTHRLRGLVDSGDVVVTTDPNDQRAKNATLTDQGMATLKGVAPAHVADVQRLIFEHLTAEQTRALADALGTVAASTCDHEPFGRDADGGTSPEARA